jgi:chloramphenicol 3-O-phosphotransferase
VEVERNEKEKKREENTCVWKYIGEPRERARTSERISIVCGGYIISNGGSSSGKSQ